MDSSIVGSFLSWEITGLVVTQLEIGSSSSFSSTSSAISTSSGGSSSRSTGVGIGGIVISNGGTIEMVMLGNIVSFSFSESGLIKIVRETLIAPFTITVILGLFLEKDSGRVGNEES